MGLLCSSGPFQPLCSLVSFVDVDMNCCALINKWGVVERLGRVVVVTVLKWTLQVLLEDNAGAGELQCICRLATDNFFRNVLPTRDAAQ